MTPGTRGLLRAIAARLPISGAVDPATSPLAELAAEIVALRSYTTLRRPVAGWLGLYRSSRLPLAERFAEGRR